MNLITITSRQTNHVYAAKAVGIESKCGRLSRQADNGQLAVCCCAAAA